MKTLSKLMLFFLLSSFTLTGSVSANNIVYDYRNGLYETVEKSGKAKNSTNQVVLYERALAYVYGYGVARNLKKGLELMAKSGQAGYLPAQLLMAKYYLIVKEQPDKALEWFKRASEQDDTSAHMFVSAAYLFGYGAKKQPDKARKYYIAAAKNGDPIAQFTLAEHFFDSRHRKNHMLAVLWLKKAAAQDYQQAIKLLANYNDDGSRKLMASNESKDNEFAQQSDNAKPSEPKKLTAKEQAARWLIGEGKPSGQFATYRLPGILTEWKNEYITKKNAQNQSPKMLGVNSSEFFSYKFQTIDPKTIKISEIIDVIGKSMYENKKPHFSYPAYSVNSLADNPERFDKIQKLANFKDRKAMFILAQHYQQGLGVEKDSQKAMELYLRASDLGDLKSKYNIGLMYLKGDGVSKDYDTAFKWLEEAAFKGNPFAQYTLGLIFEYGIADPKSNQKIEKDKKFARDMYSLSTVNEFEQAKTNLADLQLSGLFTEPMSVEQARRHHDEIVELYESAVKNGVSRAELTLAYYYIESSDKEKQQWAFEVAQREQENGNPFATFLLALMFDRGVGVTQDEEQAIDLYKESVAHNNPIAEFIMGTYYHDGKLVTKNENRAIDLLHKAIKTNLPFALYNLAVIMHNKDPNSHFVPLLKRAEQQNYMLAKLLLADYLVVHKKDQKSLRTAGQIYQQLAQLGYPEAQLKLAYMYDKGISFSPNYELAGHWYTLSAQQGNKYAQYFLANMYQVGKLGEPDFEQAKSWYYKAAEQKMFQAIVAMGVVNETMAHNYQDALEWYQFAAKSNNPVTWFNLALMYEYGKGRDVDFDKAYELYIEGEAKGYLPAQVQLAKLYYQGAGVKKDLYIASSMFKKAANRNDPYAQYQLGYMYEQGLGVEKNAQKASEYYKKAAAKGVDLAYVGLQRINQLSLQPKAEVKDNSAIEAKTESVKAEEQS